jgi:hypothetical protein
MWGEAVGLAFLAGLLFWLLRGRNAKLERSEDLSDLSYEEMEARKELHQAEEEVRERESRAQPDEDQPGDDWGPGTPRSY